VTYRAYRAYRALFSRNFAGHLGELVRIVRLVRTKLQRIAFRLEPATIGPGLPKSAFNLEQMKQSLALRLGKTVERRARFSRAINDLRT
jgi:hypothetical protein